MTLTTSTMMMVVMMMIIIIIIIIFSRMHAPPSWLITCDLTIHKYKSITEERSATHVCFKMFTIFRFSSQQVILIHQSRFLLPSFGYRPQIEY